MQQYLKLLVSVIIICSISLTFPSRSEALTIKQHLVVVPFYPENKTAEKEAWFGQAIRQSFTEVVLNLPHVLAVSEVELNKLLEKYEISSTTLDKIKLTQMADKNDVGLCFGSYQLNKNFIQVTCYVIPSRNAPVITIKKQGQKNKLKKLLSDITLEAIEKLELNYPKRSLEIIKDTPGTNHWKVLKDYTQAMVYLKERPLSRAQCQQALPRLNQVIAADRNCLNARALRASCLLATCSPKPSKQSDTKIALAKKDIDYVLARSPQLPLIHNAHIEYLTFKNMPAQAAQLSEKYIKMCPVNHRQYFLAGHCYRLLNLPDKAEKYLLEGVAFQTTAYQKNAYYKELGMLFLERNNQLADQYLQSVLQVEPNNSKYLFLHASALFHLKKYTQAMQTIRKVERLKSDKEVLTLKHQIAVAGADHYFERRAYDDAYNFAGIAFNFDDKDFKLNLLIAKILRNKKLIKEARKQLERTAALTDAQQGKNYYFLAKEFAVQGYRREAVTIYEKYLQHNPTADEAEQIHAIVRRLRGDNE